MKDFDPTPPVPTSREDVEMLLGTIEKTEEDYALEEREAHEDFINDFNESYINYSHDQGI